MRLDRGLRGRGLAKLARLGTRYEYRHPVGEALGGALRGRSPRTREGRIGPTAQMRGERGEERGKSALIGLESLDREPDVA